MLPREWTQQWESWPYKPRRQAWHLVVGAKEKLTAAVITQLIRYYDKAPTWCSMGRHLSRTQESWTTREVSWIMRSGISFFHRCAPTWCSMGRHLSLTHASWTTREDTLFTIECVHSYESHGTWALRTITKNKSGINSINVHLLNGSSQVIITPTLALLRHTNVGSPPSHQCWLSSVTPTLALLRHTNVGSPPSHQRWLSSVTPTLALLRHTNVGSPPSHQRWLSSVTPTLALLRHTNIGSPPSHQRWLFSITPTLALLRHTNVGSPPSHQCWLSSVTRSCCTRRRSLQASRPSSLAWPLFAKCRAEPEWVTSSSCQSITWSLTTSWSYAKNPPR